MNETEQQMSLIAGESDEALLVPRTEAAKRFTGATVDKLELKRNYILDLLGFGMPVETVAERTGASTRVVNLLGAKYAQLVASRNLEFAKVLKAKAAEFLFYASQKAPQAKFGELMVGVGIAAQRGLELEIAGAAVHPEDAALDIESESPALAKAREFLEKQRKNHEIHKIHE